MRIHLEIFRELTATFLLGVGALLSLILIGRLIQLRDLFLGQRVGLWDMLTLFFYLSPSFLLLLIPIGCLLAVYLTFLRMGNDRELVALKAGGISLHQLTPAPLAFCLLAAGLNLFIAFHGLSWGLERFRDEVLAIARDKAQLMLQPGVFNSDFPGLTLFAERFDNATQEMQTVFVRDERDPRSPAVILAPRGRLATDREAGVIRFVLEDGAINQLGGLPEKQAGDRPEALRQTTLNFRTYVVNLDLGRLVRGQPFGQVRPREMSYARLLELRADPRTGPTYGDWFIRKVRTELVKRLALPAAALALGMFALPLACSFVGLRQYVGTLLTLGLFLGYYALFSVANGMGEKGLAPPWALWLPNGLFLLLGLAGLRLAARERSPGLGAFFQHLRVFGRKGDADAGSAGR